MLRIEVSEEGQAVLPTIDTADPVVVIGSDAAARIRLPATAARHEHVRIEQQGWVALAQIHVDGVPRRTGERGEIGAGIVIEIGAYRVRIAPSPDGVSPSPPQRTESLARELLRSLLGSGAAPSLEVTSGPMTGAIRILPAPEATLVIGRGDEAGWVILDEDLSRAHAEVRRGWDGITIRDLGSKNGTSIDGRRLVGAGELHDGALVELGNVVLRFSDPAETHLRGESSRVTRAAAIIPSSGSSRHAPPPSRWGFVTAAAIAGLAVAALVWVLAS